MGKMTGLAHGATAFGDTPEDGFTRIEAWVRTAGGQPLAVRAENQVNETLFATEQDRGFFTGTQIQEPEDAGVGFEKPGTDGEALTAWVKGGRVH